MKRNLAILLVLVVLAIAYPQVFPNYLAIPITILLFIGWASSWDLIGGWAGQVSLGHAGFVGLGAYFVAIGAERFDIAPWWSLLAAMGFSAFFAMLWGGLTFRLQGPYFALSTIAVAEMLRLVAINETWLSGGATGVFISTLPEPFGVDLFDRRVQFYLALLFAASVLLAVILISRVRFGYQLRAVREDEQSAMAAGINPARVKLKAFMLSGALTAFGGGIYGMYLSFMEPHVMFNLLLSIQIALTAIIGGRGTVWGPAIGAMVLIGAGEMFRTVFAQANMLVYGLLILAVVLFFPRGIMGELVRRQVRRAYARGAQG
ncbi:MAG: branched-chain amino acid ABC transporter permease [Burkholderiaceae bacterium]